MTTGAPLYLVTACSSAEEFVAAFRRYTDRIGLFVPIAAPIGAGKRGRLAITLTTGGVMLEGEVEVVSSSTRASALYGRVGMTLRFVAPDEPSKLLLEELDRARIAMKPGSVTAVPRPSDVAAEPRPTVPAIGGKIDAANALAESVAIGDIYALRGGLTAVLGVPVVAAAAAAMQSGSGSTKTKSAAEVVMAASKSGSMPAAPVEAPAADPDRTAEDSGATRARSASTPPANAPPKAAQRFVIPLIPTMVGGPAPTRTPAAQSTEIPSLKRPGVVTGSQPPIDDPPPRPTPVPSRRATPTSSPVARLLEVKLAAAKAAEAKAAEATKAAVAPKAVAEAAAIEAIDAEIKAAETTAAKLDVANLSVADSAKIQIAAVAAIDTPPVPEAPIAAIAPAIEVTPPPVDAKPPPVEAKPEPVAEVLVSAASVAAASVAAPIVAAPIVAAAPAPAPSAKPARAATEDAELIEADDEPAAAPATPPPTPPRKVTATQPSAVVPPPRPPVPTGQVRPIRVDPNPTVRGTAAPRVPAKPVVKPLFSFADGGEESTDLSTTPPPPDGPPLDAPLIAASSAAPAPAPTVAPAPAPPVVADRGIRITEPPMPTEPRDTAVMTAEPGGVVGPSDVDAHAPTIIPGELDASAVEAAARAMAIEEAEDMAGDWTMSPDSNIAIPLPPQVFKVPTDQDWSNTPSKMVSGGWRDAKPSSELPAAAPVKPGSSPSLRRDPMHDDGPKVQIDPTLIEALPVLDEPALGTIPPDGPLAMMMPPPQQPPPSPPPQPQPMMDMRPTPMPLPPPPMPPMMMAPPMMAPPMMAPPMPMAPVPAPGSPDGWPLTSSSQMETVSPVTPLPFQIPPLPQPPYDMPAPGPYMQQPMPQMQQMPPTLQPTAHLQTPNGFAPVAVDPDQQMRLMGFPQARAMTDAGTGFFRDSGEMAHYPVGDNTALVQAGRRRRLIVIIASALLAVTIGIVAVLAMDGSSSSSGNGGGGSGTAKTHDGLAPPPSPLEPRTELVDAGAAGSVKTIADAASAPATVADAAAVTCFANVSSSPPGVDVSLEDGPVVAKTPDKIEVPCGKKTKIVFHKVGLVSQSRVVTGAPDAQLDVAKVALAKVTFTIKISSVPPGAAITVNGKSQGATPSTMTLPAFEAASIMIAKDGFEPYMDKITPKQNNATVHATLKRKPKPAH